MSYNISTWKTKKLEGLIIPLSAFVKHHRTDWHPEIKRDDETSEMTVTSFGSEIRGDLLPDELLLVKEMNISREGSGTFFDEILKPAVEESAGIVKAVLIWAGGDSITKLKVKDGIITNKVMKL